MESFNLKAGSKYINNLLLARGLLRDGKEIEFAHPSRGEGGKEMTMAHIINLVHDLILKRDRDQEFRESVAGTLRNLRTELARANADVEKLQTKNADLSRQVSLAQSQERSARAALRTAESSARSLREEMLRLKTTVQQVRTSCANDVRKRDKEIQRLKSHLQAQQRGNRSGVTAASITINPGTIGLSGMNSTRDDGPSVDDPGYSLRQETTEFLTQLSQSLSDDNDNLLGLVRSTLSTLKELQRMPEVPRPDEDGDLTTIGEEEDDSEQGMMQGLPTSYEKLASDMDTVLENLKTLLTNPNFVSLEEVEMREEEIVKLRAGWDKMEARWRDTLALMEGWRRRMAEGGDTINLEDLTRGLGLSTGMDMIDSQDASVISEEEEDPDSSDLDAELGEEDEDMEDPSSPTKNVHGTESTSGTFAVKLQHDLPALKESTGNVKLPQKSPRTVAFSASIPNTPLSEAGNENVIEDAASLDTASATKRRRTPTLATAKAHPVDQPSSRPTSVDSRKPRQGKKRLSSGQAHPEEPSPKLTVCDKLRQAEAEAAAVISSSPLKPDQTQNGDDAKLRPRASPIKSRIGGHARRRRKSTLTPEELQGLLGFD